MVTIQMLNYTILYNKTVITFSHILYPDDGIQQDRDNQMITLANQIIAAMPEHIKYCPGASSDELHVEEVFSVQDRRSSYGSYSSSGSAPTPPCTEDSGISTPLEGMAFEEYRLINWMLLISTAMLSFSKQLLDSQLGMKY